MPLLPALLSLSSLYIMRRRTWESGYAYATTFLLSKADQEPSFLAKDESVMISLGRPSKGGVASKPQWGKLATTAGEIHMAAHRTR
ncbi:hypothetical protein E4T56_gene2864 [Termitomyces sp. T112]|nr:hypothetical protein E4T56_gene2864 [Termitomyces sp. T112]